MPASIVRIAATISLMLLAVDSGWNWPTAADHEVIRGYIAPATQYAAGHRGIDLAAAPGSEVLAPDDGVVHFAGMVGARPVLSIDHGGGVISSFEPVDAAVAEGERVVRGQVVAKVAASPVSSVDPHCAISCLHVGARRNGRYLSPLVFLGGAPHAVLLPNP
jgi:murein DD-endopeptidase MepM/ murein hydrolase activator NlpD